jgi:hypothetical protein
VNYLLKSLLTTLAALQLSPALASPAVDSPTNYTTATWTNGANQGTGFTPWQFYTSGNSLPSTSYFNVGLGNFPSTTTWNIDSDTNSTSGVYRGYRSLEIAESVGVVFKIDAVSSLASRVGFRLLSGDTVVFFAEYEDDSNRWNINNSMSWTKADPLAVTEFTWSRDGAGSYGYTFKYDGTTIVGLTDAPWNLAYPDGIEIYSAYQGVETGGIAVASLTAPAIVPEPSTILLLALAAILGLARQLSIPRSHPATRR